MVQGKSNDKVSDGSLDSEEWSSNNTQYAEDEDSGADRGRRGHGKKSKCMVTTSLPEHSLLTFLGVEYTRCTVAHARDLDQLVVQLRARE